MAKFISSTFGTISGKHGTAVAVVGKNGTNFLRIHRVPTNTRTEKQVKQREKFSFSVKEMRPFNALFKETLKSNEMQRRARSHAFKFAVVGEHPDFELNYEELKFSFGSMETLSNVSCDADGNVLEFGWEMLETVGSYIDDSVAIILYNEKTRQSIHEAEWAYRGDESASFTLPEAWEVSDVRCWVYLAQGNMRSDSQLVVVSV